MLHQEQRLVPDNCRADFKAGGDIFLPFRCRQTNLRAGLFAAPDCQECCIPPSGHGGQWQHHQPGLIIAAFPLALFAEGTGTTSSTGQSRERANSASCRANASPGAGLHRYFRMYKVSPVGPSKMDHDLKALNGSLDRSHS
jgi:hypothetical protein